MRRTRAWASYRSFVPPDQEIYELDEEQMARIREELGRGGWQCNYAQTMNENWHDDVLCTDGTSYDRPNLLPGWGFITRDEIMAAAADYEAQLNGR